MGDVTSGPPMQRQPGQGIGTQPGANGPAGWMQPQPGSVTAAVRAGQQGSPMFMDMLRQSAGLPGAQTSQWSSQGPQIRGGDTMRGDPFGAFAQQLQSQMNPNQQMAAQYGGRMGLGNPFNSPYSGMRQPGPNYGMGQNYAQQDIGRLPPGFQPPPSWGAGMQQQFGGGIPK